jgi:hypothetical protein
MLMVGCKDIKHLLGFIYFRLLGGWQIDFGLFVESSKYVLRIAVRSVLGLAQSAIF